MIILFHIIIANPRRYRTYRNSKQKALREGMGTVTYGKGKKQAVEQTIEIKMCDNIRQYTIRGDNSTGLTPQNDQ